VMDNINPIRQALENAPLSRISVDNVVRCGRAFGDASKQRVNQGAVILITAGTAGKLRFAGLISSALRLYEPIVNSSRDRDSRE